MLEFWWQSGGIAGVGEMLYKFRCNIMGENVPLSQLLRPMGVELITQTTEPNGSQTRKDMRVQQLNEPLNLNRDLLADLLDDRVVHCPNDGDAGIEARFLFSGGGPLVADHMLEFRSEHVIYDEEHRPHTVRGLERTRFPATDPIPVMIKQKRVRELTNYTWFFGAFHKAVGQDVGPSGMNYKFLKNCAGRRQEQWGNISFTDVLSGRSPAAVFKWLTSGVEALKEEYGDEYWRQCGVACVNGYGIPQYDYSVTLRQCDNVDLATSIKRRSKNVTAPIKHHSLAPGAKIFWHLGLKRPFLHIECQRMTQRLLAQMERGRVGHPLHEHSFAGRNDIRYVQYLQCGRLIETRSLRGKLGTGAGVVLESTRYGSGTRGGPTTAEESRRARLC
ncbi:hypothetical protein C8R44DRAFT_755189 [Mycena epipterygia]|nr:hypothetical protein C8R44DRAFT_755189 [Mycena epipterygia]